LPCAYGINIATFIDQTAGGFNGLLGGWIPREVVYAVFLVLDVPSHDAHRRSGKRNWQPVDSTQFGLTTPRLARSMSPLPSSSGSFASASSSAWEQRRGRDVESRREIARLPDQTGQAMNFRP
jgi:hypothetical protein